LDSRTEEIVSAPSHWLDGLIEVNPYAAIALVALAVFATLVYLWRRLRARKRTRRGADRS
jgi:hypothetical protein